MIDGESVALAMLVAGVGLWVLLGIEKMIKK
jgi:hypothetical protein